MASRTLSGSSQTMPAVNDLFITEELARRPARRTNYLHEKNALQDLARRMVDHPEEVLPRFVDLAMEMTDGVPAGLSLFEPEPSPGVFRWRYLQGSLSPFEGATTPRDFSPCGVTLDENGPVLSHHPERVYNWISNAGIIVPEVLLVPLYLRGDAPLGTLWIVSNHEGHFDSGDARAMTELASFVGIALRMAETEHRLQRALEEQETLAKEMNHRVKNAFAVIDGMIRAGSRAGSAKEMAEVLSGRLHALADAHALAKRKMTDLVEEPAEATTLHQIVEAIVRPHDRSRFIIAGEDVPFGDRSINGLALVMHELATNAVKYGALSKDEGRVSVRWHEVGGKLHLFWVERGGPEIASPPLKTGFGTRLVDVTITRQFEGALEYNWNAEGLEVNITLPRSKVEQ